MKKRTIFIIISLILMIVPYFINVYSVFRLLSYTLGVILFSIITYKNKKNILVNIMIIVTLFLSSYFIDYYMSNYTRIPIFSVQVKSSKDVKSYYSITYKLDKCKNNYNIDKWYLNDYLCSEEDLPKISINDFLSYYERNKKSYYKIEGKISKIVGESTIEISPYEYKEEAKNGEVLFKQDIVISIPVNKSIDISNYKIYDELMIIGRVENTNNTNGTKFYNLTDAIIYKSKIYDEYEISYKEDKKCQYDKTLLSETEENKFYVSCLNDLTVKYNNENIYDLDYVLLDKKITLEDLTKRSESFIQYPLGKVYTGKDIKFVLCNNNDVIFASSFDEDLKYCEVEEEEGV